MADHLVSQMTDWQILLIIEIKKLLHRNVEAENVYCHVLVYCNNMLCMVYGNICV